LALPAAGFFALPAFVAASAFPAARGDGVAGGA